MFCWKKHCLANENGSTTSNKWVLPDLVMASKQEYGQLSTDEKQHLVKEFSEFRINDVTHILKAIKNELHNLKSCTSIKTIFYATHGTTDLPLQGVAFNTKGIEDFMGTVMGIGTQDLVSKMEGFAVQGAAKNHQQCVSQLHAVICEIINCKLCDSKVKMQWMHYF
ncbi:hypothetical protein J3A83DRAFT_4193763 [Scleroderma citrinum]